VFRAYKDNTVFGHVNPLSGLFTHWEMRVKPDQDWTIHFLYQSLWFMFLVQ